MPSQLIYGNLDENAFPQDDPRIPLEDGSKIDFWTHTTSERPEKLIIHAVGNGDRYEHHIDEYQAEAERFPNARIVAFNFRNVGNSAGKACSEEDWIKDALAVLNHFRAQEFRTENILLSGHSLGAAILTLAAAKDYENRGRQDCVRVLNNRTFSDLPTEIVEGILGKSGSIFFICLALAIPFSILGALYAAVGLAIVETLPSFFPALPSFSICKEVMKGVFKPLLWAIFGTMDVATAYRALLPEARDYVMAKNDEVIPPSASLHAAFSKAERRQEKQSATQDNEVWLNIKDRKLKSGRGVNPDGHNDPLSYLWTYHKKRKLHLTHEDNRPPQINGQEVQDNKTRRLLGL